MHQPPRAVARQTSSRARPSRACRVGRRFGVPLRQHQPQTSEPAFPEQGGGREQALTEMTGTPANAEVLAAHPHHLADRPGDGVQRQVRDNHGRGAGRARAVKLVQRRGGSGTAQPARRRHHAPVGKVPAGQAELLDGVENGGQAGHRLLVGVPQQFRMETVGNIRTGPPAQGGDGLRPGPNNAERAESAAKGPTGAWKTLLSPCLTSLSRHSRPANGKGSRPTTRSVAARSSKSRVNRTRHHPHEADYSVRPAGLLVTGATEHISSVEAGSLLSN